MQLVVHTRTLRTGRPGVKVYSNDGLTLRGTLVAMQAAALSNSFATSKTNRKFPLNWSSSGAALTQVVAQENDCIVIEIGGRVFTAATGGTVSVVIGDPTSDSDLSENETDTADGVPWFEFSQDIAFVDDAAGPSRHPGFQVPVFGEDTDQGTAVTASEVGVTIPVPPRARPQALRYKMRGRDVDCPGLTYRYWVTVGLPDMTGTLYTGPKCGSSPLADVTVLDIEVTDQ